MERTHKERTSAIQRSIELATTNQLGLLHPTRYKQHNPNLADRIEGVHAIHSLLPLDKVYVHVVRAFEDGDYGFVHVDYHLFEHTVAFDIHRYEAGISVEHWDNLQDMPTGRNKAGRTMTDGKTQVKDLHKTADNKALVQQFTQQV
jgi:predicted SnoaL-like aldol condensation-catalyzing enzyme